jgi:uncharacterized protein (TIGR03437 family)
MGPFPLATNGGTLQFNTGVGEDTSVTFQATFSIAPITASPTSLTFTAVQGGPSPAAQTLVLGSSDSGLAVSRTGSSLPTWLTLTNWIGTGTLPVTIPVVVNSSGLLPGTYSFSLGFNTVYNASVTVPITLVVTAPPQVSVSPSLLNFAYQSGGNLPQAQELMVSGAGAASTFTATPSSSGWLSVSPTSGTTPNTGTFPITATANPTGLNAGTYNGSITISGTGVAIGTTIVNVSLVVSAPVPAITKVTNAASFATGSISPGEIISIFANASNPIGPTPYVQLNSATCPTPCTNVPVIMGGVQVKFLPQGIFAPLLYVSATQINAVVPYEVQTAGSNLSVEVLYLGQASNAFPLQTATTAPGIVSLNGSGTGTAAMNQYDTSGNYQGINSGSNPASSGWYLVMYVTGEGSIPSPVDGSVTSAINIKPLVGPPSVLIDDTPSTVTYYAEAVGFVSGVLQVQVQIPTGIRTSQADSLLLTIGGNTIQTGVTVQIK